MTASPDLTTSTDPLEAMLADPETRQALAVIVANAPTLAALSTMASALLQRGPEIADNINELVRQLRVEGAGDENAIGGAIGSLASLAPLAPALAERTDTITTLLDSPVLAPEVVQVIGRVGQAAVEADAETGDKQAQVGGSLAIRRELKDPGVQEGLAFLFAFAKAFGRQQSQA